MLITFKKTFFKDFQKLPDEIKTKVNQLVLQIIPNTANLQKLNNIKKITGFESFYRIRIGNYRLGLKYEYDKITIYRVLHRKDIYKYFP